MLALISPAKKLDYDAPAPIERSTQHAFQKDTAALIKILSGYSKDKIQSLMKLSDKLGQLNYDRYQGFEEDFTPHNSKQAAYAFMGDTYVGLEAPTLSAEDMDFAQDHLGILSGLYGMLRPLDLMQPYRLEMGTKLPNPAGEDLYDFWGQRITQAVNEAVKNHEDKSVISLASNEYIKAVQPKALDGAFITCHFKEVKNGEPKTIGLFAKRARGAMARYIIQNRIETPGALKGFDTDGYIFNTSLSDDTNLIFLRDQKSI